METCHSCINVHFCRYVCLWCPYDGSEKAYKWLSKKINKLWKYDVQTKMTKISYCCVSAFLHVSVCDVLIMVQREAYKWLSKRIHKEDSEYSQTFRYTERTGAKMLDAYQPGKIREGWEMYPRYNTVVKCWLFETCRLDF